MIRIFTKVFAKTLIGQKTYLSQVGGSVLLFAATADTNKTPNKHHILDILTIKTLSIMAQHYTLNTNITE